MLLIDGVIYQEWIPEKEIEEFHPLVKEHFREIFGTKCIYAEGNILKSESGIGSKPDWFVISFGDTHEWYIVEAELSSHHLYDHIVNQVGRFINGIKNTAIQRKMVEAIYHEITENKVRKAELEEAIGSGEIYKFLYDLISRPPILTIIIEKKTPELEEAVNLLRYSPIRIIEFQTFTREGAGLAVHAHLFEPSYEGERVVIEEGEEGGNEIGRVTPKDLIKANLLMVGQEIHRTYRSKEYKAKILQDGLIELDGETFPTLNSAIKHITNTSMDAWYFWRTYHKDGTECELNELRDEYRSKL